MSLFGRKKRLKGLLGSLNRLVGASKRGDLNISLEGENLSAEELEVVSLINESIRNYKLSTDYSLTRYKLTINAMGVALWDLEIVEGDPANPNNITTWSDEFRRMLGFTGESDFPNVLSSWSDRLHPEDKDYAFAAFGAHLQDRTGKTPYDLVFRLKLKNETYRHFRAFGSAMRDSRGVAVRMAGALEDVEGRIEAENRLKKEQDLLKNSNFHALHQKV